MFQVYSVKKVGEKKANISPLSFFFFFRCLEGVILFEVIFC